MQLQTSKLVAASVIVLVLACGGLGPRPESSAGSSDGSASPAVQPGSDAPAHGRAGHFAVTLKDGRVLFAGGNDSPAAAELYNPVAGTWAGTGALVQARFGHAMVGLADGRALLVGGEDPALADPNADPTGLTHAEVFEPSTGGFTAVAPSGSGFLAPKAALLPDGQVLVVNCEVGEVRAERYDPAANVWSAAPSPDRCAADDDLVSIAGGVLIGSGGAGYALERFDAKTGSWGRTAPAPRKRTNRLAVLSDGRVLATGRRSAAVDEPDAAVFDPASNAWTPTADLPVEVESIDHADFALVAEGGRVWRVGGSSGRPPTIAARVEVYDAQANAWSVAGPLKQARAHATATALPDGAVLVYGGRGERGGAPLATAEIVRR